MPTVVNIEKNLEPENIENLNTFIGQFLELVAERAENDPSAFVRVRCRRILRIVRRAREEILHALS